MNEESEIQTRLAQVRATIAEACHAAGRDPGAVTLIAVSKKQPLAAIRAAYDAGQRDFGENYVQELVEKRAALNDLEGIRWHLIGHVQRNKVKYLFTDDASVLEIQTLDNEKIVDEFDRFSTKSRKLVPIWLQINVAGENQKFGCTLEQLPPLLAYVRTKSNLDVRGLMTIPPAEDDPEHVRPHFSALRELAKRHRLPGLSMGMSSDYPIAIAEGATHVRVGGAIFGERA